MATFINSRGKESLIAIDFNVTGTFILVYAEIFNDDNFSTSLYMYMSKFSVRRLELLKIHMNLTPELFVMAQQYWFQKDFTSYVTLLLEELRAWWYNFLNQHLIEPWRQNMFFKRCAVYFIAKYVWFCVWYLL